ncbi:MAG TPA: 50S ribosomal protein L25 [Gaiellaceae bacterium]|nr:50S ribosomal protein L25 [Gaiellaceae bacterium]
MAGERTKLVVAQRDTLGSAEARRLRRRGLIPGVLYGNGEPLAIAVAERELRRALSGTGGLHAILDVEVDGKGATRASILKDYQVDPVRGGVTHVDLQEVRLDRPIQASVSVHLVGGEDAPGVREGGVLSQPLREVSVEALPLEVPEHLEADVSGLEVGGTLRVADLATPDGVTLLDDPETVVATVTAPTRVVEAEELAEGEEAEAAAGEEAGAEPAEAPSEPAEAVGDEGAGEG